MRPSLRAFLFAALASAALGPTAYLGLTQAGHWQEVQRRDADKELRFAAEGLARTLGQALDTNVREIIAVANAVGLQGTKDHAVLQALLHQYCSTFPSCLGVNVSTSDGVPIVMEPSDHAAANIGDRSYFQTMLRTKRASVSGVELGRIAWVPTIHVCAPVWMPPSAEHPTLGGAVVGATGLGYLQELTGKAVEIFGDMRAQVLDANRHVVLDSSPAGVPALTDRSNNPMYAAVPAGKASLRDGRNDQAEQVRLALARVSEQGVDWTVAVMRPTKTIEEQASRARVSTLIAIAAALMLGFFFAYVISSWLARPISQLARYAARVARGEAAPIPPHGRLDAREVSELVENVFSMVLQLQRQATALREREAEQILLARIRQELDIAERIQTGILPKHFSLPGFESAARMKPAEAVGGDYYEILPTASGFWIAAGDVSGHGLNAGLVMLMLQSALAALAIYAPGARPAELLKATNCLLVENIRHRLGGDDHVTLVLMHVDLDGSFVFAGGHEPLLVLRASSGKCEVIDTPGPWMGILPDIGRHLAEGSGRLEPGDLLLFHSDGIVESGSRQHTPYGLERLCAAVERLGDQPADVVCREILREAEEWSSGKQEDDMTVVAVRRASGPSF
jgi:serine phosphatase RsbU (regulator of sigma subunit)